MNITFSLELSSSKTSSVQHSVMIRITKNRKLKRFSTGIKVEKKYWDRPKQKIKASHPLAKEYNKLLQEQLRKTVASYTTLFESDDDISLYDAVSLINNVPTTDFFEFAYRTKMAEIKSTNKLGTYRRYEAVLSKLKVYTGSKIGIKKVNYTFLQAYVLYLKNTLKNTDDTISSNLSVIRTIINEAIKHGLYKDRNPFDQLKLKYTDTTKEKLTAEELKRLFVTILPQIPSLTIARDFFLACFLAEGSRAGDILLMRKEHIVNQCLVFEQQKTGSKMRIPITPELNEIIERYSSKGDYLFPQLNNEPVVNEIILVNKLTYINKWLKEVAKYCGIHKKLSTHVARHTFTDLALQATNGNIYEVQKSLGHSSVKTTERYSRQRVNYERKSEVGNILKTVLASPSTK
jgi:integrase/recombinase XerD